MKYRAVRIYSLILGVLVLLGGELAFAQHQQITIQPFIFENYKYKVDSDKKMDVVILPKGGLMVVGFQGRSDDETAVPRSFLVLGRQTDKHVFVPLQYLNGNDHYIKIEMYDLNGTGEEEIFFWSFGGTHYTDLEVYKIENNQLKEIFEAGSSCNVEILKTADSFAIKKEREKFDDPKWSYPDPSDRYEVWVWHNGEFEFSKERSTLASPEDNL